MNLSKLFYFHSIITFLAGAILFISPASIPGVLEISIEKHQYLLCYFLGSAEISIAFLSFKAVKIMDKNALIAVVQTIIVFHLLTASAEGFAFLNVASKLIIINIIARLLVSYLFYHYYSKLQTQKK